MVDSEEKPDGWLGSWCAECGPDVGVDEDGLCTSCGSTAVGYGADEATKVLARVELAEAENRGLRSALANMETKVCELGRRADAAGEERDRLREALRTIVQAAVAPLQELSGLRLADAIMEASKLLEPQEPPRG